MAQYIERKPNIRLAPASGIDPRRALQMDLEMHPRERQWGFDDQPLARPRQPSYAMMEQPLAEPRQPSYAMMEQPLAEPRVNYAMMEQPLARPRETYAINVEPLSIPVNPYGRRHGRPMEPTEEELAWEQYERWRNSFNTMR